MFPFMIETLIEKPGQRFEFTVNNKNRTDFRLDENGQICPDKADLAALPEMLGEVTMLCDMKTRCATHHPRCPNSFFFSDSIMSEGIRCSERSCVDTIMSAAAALLVSSSPDDW